MVTQILTYGFETIYVACQNKFLTTTHFYSVPVKAYKQSA